MKIKAAIAFVAYILCIPAANWMLSNVGIQFDPNGPHLLNMGWGFYAPSGVLLIGVALASRDAIQQIAGMKVTLVGIVCGVIVSWFVNPAIAVASATAFALGEIADLVVYTPIRRRNIAAAIVTSGIVGGIVDTFVFLQIAFGSTKFWEGQVIGKTAMATVIAASVWVWNAVSKRFVPR